MTDTTLTHANAQAGDLAELVSPNNKSFTIRLTPGGRLSTHRGYVDHDELIGKPWGSQVFSHLGSTFFMVQPTLADIIQETRRNTQIMYPKDIGFTLMMMGVGPGQHILEAGTGSGALTTALAWMVGPTGHVTSYDIRSEMQSLARKNLERVGLEERVSLKLGDIAEGFDEEGVDAIFLDVPNPYDYIAQVRRSLKPGGIFGSILPTINQVTKLLTALRQNDFAFIEVVELLLRYYKPEPERLRPVDRMIAHTGFLTFARPVIPVKKTVEDPNAAP
jgi:tRNA (adenine57-N1/adenine58-N1)-methyltransferase